MLNNKDSILIYLRRLGLTPEESKVYLALLRGSMSHLEVSRKTGVNRTKVYRIVDTLSAKGLVSNETSIDGRILAAKDPANLEISITTAEEKLKHKRETYLTALPILQAIHASKDRPQDTDFIVNTYEGIDGFRQMLWHELKANGELLIYGSGTIDDLVSSSRWAEKHRIKTLEAGYKIREILNPDSKAEQFTKNRDFLEKAYQKRLIPPSILPLDQQIVVYNNTVTIYNWRYDQKVGAEIINRAFADTHRSIFERYWNLAK